MATEINIKKAVREKIWAKVALMGASGSGKTYSALRLATGMLEKLKEIGLEQKWQNYPNKYRAKAWLLLRK